MRTWSKKTTTCITCGDEVDWTTRKPKWCAPCRKVEKYKGEAAIRRAKGMKQMRPREIDPLPKVDWVMERQFPNFFDLIGKRYTGLKDVTKVIDNNHYRQQTKTG